ncbi:MAG: hypothetical protein WBV82_01035 [Myxococcaceae bacterium]
MASNVRMGSAAACLAALVLSSVACGPADNTLGGSVSELFPLEVSRVDVLRNDQALQVSYYNNNGTELDLVLQLTVALQDVTFEKGAKIPLQGEYAPGHQRTTVVHFAGGEPRRQLPNVSTGDLVIDEGGGIDEQTRGNFSMSFEQHGEFGSGRNVNGAFNAVARDGGFGDLVE